MAYKLRVDPEIFARFRGFRVLVAARPRPQGIPVIDRSQRLAAALKS